MGKLFKSSFVFLSLNLSVANLYAVTNSFEICEEQRSVTKGRAHTNSTMEYENLKEKLYYIYEHCQMKDGSYPLGTQDEIHNISLKLQALKKTDKLRESMTSLNSN